jgi:hypothetical protein
MNPTFKSLGFSLLIFLIAGAPATKPTSQPVMQSMAEDLIHYVAPPDPWVSHDTNVADSVYFQTPKGDSAIQAIYAPKDFVLSSAEDGAMAAQMVQQIRKEHQDKKVEMVQPPKIIIDKRFDIVIHEKFKVSKDVTEDETHLYKSVGPRVVMVTVSCLSDDKKIIDAAHKAAEDLLASCKFNRKAFKKQ